MQCGTNSEAGLAPYCASCDIRNPKRCSVCSDPTKTKALYVDPVTGACKA